MELIDKAAVVAKIERIIEEPAPSHDSQCSWEDGYYCGLCKAESIIDNLEVKEMDLEEEARKYKDKVYLERGYQDSYGTPHAPFHHIGDAFIAGAEFMIKAQKG